MAHGILVCGVPAACFIISHICGYNAGFILKGLHKSQCWVTVVEWYLMSLDSGSP